MFDNLFGRKGETKDGKAPEAVPVGGAPPRSRPDFPWIGQPDETACNLAFGHLYHNLKLRLTIDGRIHAETLMAAAGAIAGFAAQRALFVGALETKDAAHHGPDRNSDRHPDASARRAASKQMTALSPRHDQPFASFSAR